jgi:hypothetical protein
VDFEDPSLKFGRNGSIYLGDLVEYRKTLAGEPTARKFAGENRCLRVCGELEHAAIGRRENAVSPRADKPTRELITATGLKRFGQANWYIDGDAGSLETRLQ